MFAIKLDLSVLSSSNKTFYLTVLDNGIYAASTSKLDALTYATEDEARTEVGKLGIEGTEVVALEGEEIGR